LIDLLKGKDVEATNPGLRMYGCNIGLSDLIGAGVTRLSIRFNRLRSQAIGRIDEDGGLWLGDVKVELPTVPVADKYCRGCGEPGTGDCAGLECVDPSVLMDSVVEAFCPHCGDCRQVEPDARGYECFEDGCDGKITSPAELLW
jgi:hypothetical protein